MKDAGMDVRFVQTRKDAPTAFGVCFSYPDGSGANLAPANGASAFVDAEAVRKSEQEIAAAGPACLVVAAPEVPLEARRALLQSGRAYHAFTAASYVSGELGGGDILEDLAMVDLLALNIDEAASLARISAKEPAQRVVRACIERLSRAFPRMLLSISNGVNGAYAWEGGRLEHLPVLGVPVASTAGAGDALLSGYIVGLTAGLPFMGAPHSCFRLSRLLAAMSVMSADTINFDVSLRSLRSFAAEHGEQSPL
jgi:sugar/nucleoside kinase (ribokinase family)